MNFMIRNGRICQILIVVLLGFSALLTPTAKAQTNAVSESPQAAAEKADCTRNLKIIYDAIQAYQMDHKDLPMWLSDLVPQYISDVNVFICPVCKRTGEAETSAMSDPKISSSYLYEFCPSPLGSNTVPNNPGVTHREWKRRQMGIVGSVVPLVRCRHHEKILNLSFDGRVYESGTLWETLLTNQVKIANLTPRKIFGDDPVVGSALSTNFPPRDPQARTNLIDLTHYYNARLTDFWPSPTNNDLGDLANALQNFGGVQFDVRGMVVLRGKSNSTKKYPAEVKGIKIDQKCEKLHFIHAARFGGSAEENHRVGTYILHFASHQMQLEIPVVYGHDIRDWHPTAHEKPGATELNTVWTSSDETNRKIGGSIRFFETTWTNIAPGVEIKSIDFVSSLGAAAPFLIAITAE